MRCVRVRVSCFTRTRYLYIRQWLNKQTAKYMCKVGAPQWKAACILARIKYGQFFASAVVAVWCYLWFCFSSLSFFRWNSFFTTIRLHICLLDTRNKFRSGLMLSSENSYELSCEAVRVRRKIALFNSNLTFRRETLGTREFFGGRKRSFRGK
jgi:hypothetical protein